MNIMIVLVMIAALYIQFGLGLSSEKQVNLKKNTAATAVNVQHGSPATDYILKVTQSKPDCLFAIKPIQVNHSRINFHYIMYTRENISLQFTIRLN